MVCGAMVVVVLETYVPHDLNFICGRTSIKTYFRHPQYYPVRVRHLRIGMRYPRPPACRYSREPACVTTKMGRNTAATIVIWWFRVVVVVVVVVWW